MIVTRQNMGISVSRQLKAQAVGLAINYLTGEAPAITNYDDYTQITLSPEQIKKTHNLIDDWSARKGDIRLNTKDIVLPYVFKKYWPWAAGVALAGVIIGRLSK